MSHGMSWIIVYTASLVPEPSQQTRGIHPMLFQCWASVYESWPTLKQLGWISRVYWDTISLEIMIVDLLYLKLVHNLKNTHIINPLTAKLFNLDFHPLEVVSRWRDPQLQVSENYSDLTKWGPTVFKSCWLMSHFILNMFKRWLIMC